MTAAGRLLCVVGVVVASGCADQAPDPASIPRGPVTPGGAEPTGPITILASGQSNGRGWRYSVYESADGTCRQVEPAEGSITACGDPSPEQGSVFGPVGVGSAAGDETWVDGIVTTDVTALWVEREDGDRLPLVLMPMEPAGLDGLQAFVGFVPGGPPLESLVALDAEGDEIETLGIDDALER